MSKVIDHIPEETARWIEEQPGELTIVDVAVGGVSSSCGFGVPLMHHAGEREELAAYHERRNARSIDGASSAGPRTEHAGRLQRVAEA